MHGNGEPSAAGPVLRQFLFLPALAIVAAWPLVSYGQLASDPAALTQRSTTVRAMADSLGHIRHVFPHDSAVGAVLYVASGSMADPRPGDEPWPEYTVTKLVGEAAYFLRDTPNSIAKAPGARWEIERTGQNGQSERLIQAVAHNFAWDESEPGVLARPAMGELVARQRQLWLTPHGLAVAAAAPAVGEAGAEPDVTVRQDPETSVLTIPVGGTPVEVTLDADMRPARIEAQIIHEVLGPATLEVLYSDYQDFERAYYVFFPTRIVQRLNGKTVLDVTVHEFHTNPYVVFPVPAEVRRLAQND